MAASQSRARCFLQETNSRCMEERRIVTSSEWSLISAGNCQEFWLSGRRLLIQFTANSSSPTHHVPHSQLHSKAPCGKWRSNRTHRYKFPPPWKQLLQREAMFCYMSWEFCLPGLVTKNFTKPLNCHWHPPPKLPQTHRIPQHPHLSQLPTAPRSRDSQERNGENIKFGWTLSRK